MIDDAINCAAVPVPLCQKLTKGERSEELFALVIRKPSAISISETFESASVAFLFPVRCAVCPITAQQEYIGMITSRLQNAAVTSFL